MPIVDAKEYRDARFRCPFCLADIMFIRPINTPFGVEHEGGNCTECGSVFLFDRTGKNLGELYMDTLSLAFDWDLDAAHAAEEGTYEEAVVRHASGGAKFLLGEGNWRDRSNKYYFIKRLNKEK